MRRLFIALLLVPLAGCVGGDDSPVGIAEVLVSARDVYVATVEVAVVVTRGADMPGEDWMLRVQAYDRSTDLVEVSESVSLPEEKDAKAVSVTVAVEVPRESSVQLEVSVMEEGLVVERTWARVHNLHLLQPDLADTGLRVDHVDLRVLGVEVEEVPEGEEPKAGRVDLGAVLYVVNEGAGATEPLRAQLVAREVTTGLVVDEAWVEVPSVAVGATARIPLDLELADAQKYSLESTLWEGAFIMGRAQEGIEFGKDGSTVARSQDLVYTEPEPSPEPTPEPEYDYAEDEADDSASAPGLPLVGLGGALLVAALVVKRAQS